MLAQLHVKQPGTEIDWNAQWPDNDPIQVVHSSDVDVEKNLLPLHSDLGWLDLSVPPFQTFLLADQQMSYGDHSQIVDNDVQATLIPATAVASADLPGPLPDNMAGILESTGDIFADKGIQCKTVSPTFKQRSKGKRSRVDPTNSSASDSSSSSSNSGRASTRPLGPPLKKTATSASIRIGSTLVDDKEVDRDWEGDMDGGGGGHGQTRHNQIEKNYRNRLNDSFTRLFAAVETTASNNSEGFNGEYGSRNISKGKVLSLASTRLLALATKNRLLSIEVKRLEDIIYV